MRPERLRPVLAVTLLAAVALSACGNAAPPASAFAGSSAAPARPLPAGSTAAPPNPAPSGSGPSGGTIGPPASATASTSPGAAPSQSSPPAQTASPSPAASRTPAGSRAPAATPPPAASADLAGDLATAGTLTACTTFPSAAMATYDSTGKPVGVNVDIDIELAHRLGLTAVVANTPFGILIDEVVAGRCDISISSQIILPSRLARIDMIPYTKGQIHLAVRAGDRSIAVLIDACARRVAVQTGSIHVAYVQGTGDYAGRGLDQKCATAKREPVDLRQFANEQLAIEALGTGEVDAFIGNDLIAFQQPTVFRLGPALPAVKDGIGVAKAHRTLHAAIEAAFKAMIADGTYRDILHRYGADVISIAGP